MVVPSARDDLGQVVVGVISVARDVAEGVDRLADVALVVVEGGRRVAVGVGDRVFAGCGIGVGLDLGLGARTVETARGRDAALGVVRPLDARAIGERDRGQGVRIGRGRAGRVGVGRLAEFVREREQMLAAGIVGVSGRLVAGLGDRADQALGVVGDRDRRAVGSRQAGELAARVVAGRDSVAVGVFLVIERAVGVERDDRAVGLDVLVGAVVERQRAVFAGGGCVAAVGVLGEVEQRAVVADRDVALAVGAGADLPVVGPAEAERPHRVAAGDRGVELADEIERDRAGDGKRGVGDRVDRAGRERVVGRVDREAEQALHVVGVFAELAQIGGFVVEVGEVALGRRAEARRSGWRRRPARRRWGYTTAEGSIPATTSSSACCRRSRPAS